MPYLILLCHSSFGGYYLPLLFDSGTYHTLDLKLCIQSFAKSPSALACTVLDVEIVIYTPVFFHFRFLADSSVREGDDQSLGNQFYSIRLLRQLLTTRGQQIVLIKI